MRRRRKSQCSHSGQKWLSFSLSNSVNRIAIIDIAYQHRTGWRHRLLLLLLLLLVLVERSVFQDRRSVELFWLLPTRGGWSWSRSRSWSWSRSRCWCCWLLAGSGATSTPASSPATTTATTTRCLTATTRRTRRGCVGGGGGGGCRGSSGGGGARLLSRLSWGPPVNSEVSFWGILDRSKWRVWKDDCEGV